MLPTPYAPAIAKLRVLQPIRPEHITGRRMNSKILALSNHNPLFLSALPARRRFILWCNITARPPPLQDASQVTGFEQHTGDETGMIILYRPVDEAKPGSHTETQQQQAQAVPDTGKIDKQQ